MKRYEIWQADLPAAANSHVQGGSRPVIVVSNDMANRYSPLVTVVPLTTRKKTPLPTHVVLSNRALKRTSLALCEHILTLDKEHLRFRIGYVYDSADRYAIDRALVVQLGMAG